MPPLKRPFGLLLFGLVVSAGAQAQTSISLDGSLPNGLSGPIDPLSPGVYEIPQTLGEAQGPNLFHSFGNFDIGSGDSATFTAVSEFARVIARVTGGGASDIDGSLASTVMADAAKGIGADLYLFNPWGILVGPNASIDVPASLTLSTAQELRFADDAVLDLMNKDNPSLSVEEPTEFGFLGGPSLNPALDFDIEFGNPQTPTFLGTDPGHTLSIVGRDVAIRGRMFVTAQSGQLQVAALGSSAAEVPVELADFHTRSGDAAQLGSVELSGGAQLSTAAFDPNADQGSIVIRAGRFAMAGGIVRAGGHIDGDGAAIDIETAGMVSLAANSTISTVNQGAEDAGGVHIAAGSLEMDGGTSLIRSQVAGNGAGGDLTVEADTIALRNQAQIEARSDSLGGPAPTGAVGDVTLVATDEMRVESGADVITRTTTLGAGGDIAIEAGHLAVVDGTITAESGVSAAGGSIAIEADRIEVRGGVAQIATLNRVAAPPEPTIPGGSIRIGSEENPAESVQITGGAVVTSETSGAQPGGAIHIFADSLEVTGGGVNATGDPRASTLQTATSSASETAVGGSIFLDVGTLRVGATEPDGLAGIIAAFVAAGALGPGGSIEVSGVSALVEDGGQLSTTTLGAGNAGSIDVVLTGDFVARGSRTDGVLLPSGLFARGGAGSTGNAGDIRVSARSIEVLDAAELSSRAFGTGDSGDISLIATDAIRIVGGFQASSVLARSQNSRAGNVTLDAPQIELIDGGVADVSVSGGGQGGLLRVVADDLLISGRSATGIRSSLAAETAGAGSALGIEVDVTGRVRVEQGGQINSVTRLGGGTPGDIRITAGSIEFVEGRGTAESREGSRAAAGNIVLSASDSIRILDDAELGVFAGAGQDAGSLTLVAPEIEVRDSTLTADADGFGGDIAIQTDLLRLERANIVAFSRGFLLGPGGEGDGIGTGAGAGTPAGGNIAIEGGAVVVNQSRIVADGFGNANGGIIDITADPWLRSGDSAISASSEFGLDGFVIVNTPYGEVTGDLAALPETFLDASSLLEEPCLARDAPSGTFEVQRLRGIAPPPDAPIPAEPVGDPLQCEAP